MSTAGEREVFMAGSVPRKQIAQRRITGKCCLVFVGILGAIVWIPIAFFVGRFAFGFISDLRSPHASFATKDGSVLPLINSTDRFDVLATVWLDVTEHLKRGHTLPDEYKVVHYKHFDGVDRSEAIIYTGILFENASMASRLHTSQFIRFPVEALYTQSIGPSTVRGTLQLVPRSPPTRLQFNSSDLIYPDYLPIGPRSPDSHLITGDEKPATLSQALERSAVNVNLIRLVPTKWRSNDTTPNVRKDFGEDPPLLDGAPSNRAYLQAGSEGLLVDDFHRIRLPHLQTRSRIILIKEERRYPKLEYLSRRLGWVAGYQTECKQYKDGIQSETFVSDGQCQRQSKSSLFENKLQFLGEDGMDVQTFYAPYLAQSVSASSYRHLRTIPRSSPLATLHNSSLSPPSKDQCLIPMLNTDGSKRFFEFTWDVFFSSHEHLRAMTAENAYQHHFPAMQDFIDNGTEIRARTTFQESTNWGLQATGLGDREHPKSKPWFMAFRLVVVTAWVFIDQCLKALYWYTRVTSFGLSYKAQWLSLLTSGVEVIEQLTNFTKDSVLSFFVLFDLISLASTVVPAYFLISTLLHFDVSRRSGIVRRKATKKERDGRRLDDQTITWLLPIGIALGQFLLLRYTSSFEKHIVSPQGCQDTGPEDQASSSTYMIFHQIATALTSSTILTQLYFNFQSKTYAGTLKIAAIASFAIEAFTTSVEQFESLSGWQPSRFPVLVGEIYQLILSFVMAYQAVLYPGIPQRLETDEDVELM